MSAQIIPFDQVRRFHAELTHDALMRKVRLVARGKGCTAQQVVEIEELAEFWLSQHVRPQDIVERARSRALLIAGPAGPDGPRAA